MTALSGRDSKSPRYQRRSPSPVQLSSSVLLLPSASTSNTTISDPTGFIEAEGNSVSSVCM